MNTKKRYILAEEELSERRFQHLYMTLGQVIDAFESANLTDIERMWVLKVLVDQLYKQVITKKSEERIAEAVQQELTAKLNDDYTRTPRKMDKAMADTKKKRKKKNTSKKGKYNVVENRRKRK